MDPFRLHRCRGVAAGVGVLLLAATSRPAAGDPVADEKDFEFIEQGISPGAVYAFEGDVGADYYRMSDYTNEWFVNESASTSDIGHVTSVETYPEIQLVQRGPNGVDDSGYRAERQTFHVLAQHAVSVLPGIEGSSFAARQLWAFKVSDPEGTEDGRPLHATISGTLWLHGFLQVYGPGTALLESHCTVRERFPVVGEYAVGSVIAAHEICSYEVEHPNGFSIGAAVTIEGGVPFVGGGGGIGASRPASNERLRFDEESVDFSFPLVVQAGAYYELEVLVAGSAKNRGLPFNITSVYFDNDDDAGNALQGIPPSLGPTDSSHLLSAVEYFGLTVPQLMFSQAFTGGENWKFPKLGQIFDGKVIDMANNFSIDPVGKIGSLVEALEKLGVSPNVGENIASSGPAEGRADGRNLLAKGGIWIGDLLISIASE